MKKRLQIVALDAYTMNPGDLSWTELSDIADLKIYDRTRPDLLLGRAKEADIIITNKIIFDKKLINVLSNLKYICISATGYNNIDIQYAKLKNIRVSNVVGYAAESAAEHVFSMIFHIIRSNWKYDAQVKGGKWMESSDFCFWDHPITSLAGTKLGIIGFGKIGQQVAKVGKAFGMKILIHHTKPIEEKFEYAQVILDELWQTSDIISLHAPLNDRTQNIINGSSLSKMKNSAILINTARGGMVDESALFDALQNASIRAAGLDVLSTEPPKQKSPLYDLDNCLITPHQAWASTYSRQKLMDGVVKNIKAFLNNNPINLVN